MLNMMNKSFLDRMFKQVDNVVWDMMTGRVGFKNREGIVTCDLNLELNEPEDAPVAPQPAVARNGRTKAQAAPIVPPTPVTVAKSAPNAEINVNILEDFGMPVPAFAQSTPVQNINLGDMIYVGDRVKGWVVGKSATGKSFKILTPDGTRTEWSPPKVNMLGFDSGVMVLRSLMNMLPGGNDGLQSMQGNVMQMMMFSQMMGGDSDSTLKDMMPMLLMSQMGSVPGMNGGMFQNMMPMMMMSKMMGKDKGTNTTPSGNRPNNGKSFFG